jgi:hypothetical protein
LRAAEWPAFAPPWPRPGIGAKVILVQDRSRLGGNSSSEVKMHIVGADMHGARPGWRESGLIEEFRLDDAVANRTAVARCGTCCFTTKLSLSLTSLYCSIPYLAPPKSKAYSGPGRDTTAHHEIQRVLARSDKTESLFRIKAHIYADCTGDCRLGLEAGAKMRSGRESKAEFQESLAQEKPDGHTLGSTILFTARDYGKTHRLQTAQMGTQGYQGHAAVSPDQILGVWLLVD